MPGAVMAENPVQAMQAEPPPPFLSYPQTEDGLFSQEPMQEEPMYPPPYPAQNMQQMPYAEMPRFAGEINPEEERKYRRNKKLWRSGLLAWLILFSIVWACMIVLHNEERAFMVLLAGAAVLGATAPVNPSHKERMLITKLGTFFGVLFGFGILGMFFGSMLYGMFSSELRDFLLH